MQLNNNSDNRLREIEESNQPDLSQMDAHWKKMEALIARTPVSGKKINILKSGFIIAAMACIAFLLVVFGSKKKSIQVIPAKLHVKNKPAAILPDTLMQKIPNTKQPATVFHSPDIVIPIFSPLISRSTKPASPAKQDQVPLPSDKVLNLISDTIPTIAPDRALLLKTLLESLEKKKELFLINNLRDTVLFAKEGTCIFIPSYALGGRDSITISLKEYYQYSDMVLNRLNTASNGEQLVSGGMIDINAEKNGKALTVNPAIPIRIFFPKLTPKDSMQIFFDKPVTGGSLDRNAYSDTINWQLTTIPIDSPVFKMFIRAIDLRDNRVKAGFTNPYKGIFTKARSSKYSSAELKRLLQKKYGDYYEKIRVKRDGLNLFNLTPASGDEEWGQWISNDFGIGDTAELLPSTIRIYKLQPIDTVFEEVGFIRTGIRKIRTQIGSWLPAESRKQIGEKYNIAVDRLGLINCDRFLNSKEKKKDYIVNLKDSANSYQTMLVFQNIHSVMTGQYLNETQVIFRNIPVKEDVKLICIGINKKGESVSAIRHELPASGVIDDLKFEAASAEEIKKNCSQ